MFMRLVFILIALMSGVLRLPDSPGVNESCGIQCLWMVLHYYGLDLTFDRIKGDIGGRTKAEYLSEWGLAAEWLNLYTEENLNLTGDEKFWLCRKFIVESIRERRPAIVAIRNPPHSFVIVGIFGDWVFVKHYVGPCVVPLRRIIFVDGLIEMWSVRRA